MTISVGFTMLIGLVVASQAYRPRAPGIDPTKQQALVAKAETWFRAHFGEARTRRQWD